ncbi:MAG TPA: hypothetical protein VK531_12105 [Gemmatimonadales bacterium]|nr:hypothetical protein [Gemmatimonadales bacterium]
MSGHPHWVRAPRLACRLDRVARRLWPGLWPAIWARFARPLP